MGFFCSIVFTIPLIDKCWTLQIANIHANNMTKLMYSVKTWQRNCFGKTDQVVVITISTPTTAEQKY